MLAMAGLEGSYTTVHADESVFDHTVAGLRRGEWHGLNVTMPHKGRAAASCDVISDLAQTSESVNTLFMHDGQLHGESTDTTAMTSLMDAGRFDPGLPVLVLGSGGGAAAALAAVRDREIYVSARRPGPGAELARRFDAQALAWGTPVAGAIVINSTPIGMTGDLLPNGILENCGGLVDLAYSDVETPAVTEARSRRLPLVDGYEFLVRQAIDSFAIWTDSHIEFERLMETLRKA